MRRELVAGVVEERRRDDSAVDGDRERVEVEVGREAARVAAAAHDEVGVGESRPQALFRRDDVGRVHGRAAAAEHVRAHRVGSDEGDAARGRPVPDGVGLVAAQHDRRSHRDIPDELRLIGPRRQGELGGVESTDASGEQQDARDLVVDDRLGHLARDDRRQQRVLPGATRSRHDEVETAERRSDGRPGRHPVADHGAVEAQLALEQPGDEAGVVGHRSRLDSVVDLVVGRHHRPGAGVHRVLEGREVDLAHRLGVDPRDVVGAIGLGVVGDVVLDAGRDALVLDAGHDAGADDRGEQRVLGVALEVASADGGALDVDLRREHDVDAVAACLPRECPADLDGEVDIPGRPDGARSREEGGGLALDLAETADPDRAVGHRDRAEADARQLVEAPDGLAGQEGDLLFQRQELSRAPECRRCRARARVRRSAVSQGLLSAEWMVQRKVTVRSAS